MESEKNRENPLKLDTILTQLTKDQLRFIVAMQEYPTKDAAAKAIRISPRTVYEWPPIVDEAARLLALDSLQAARSLRKRNLVKAMGVKAAGLNSKDEKVRQSAATEIIEWELGKAEQRTDITTQGEKLGTDDTRNEILRKLDRIATAITPAGMDGQPDTGGSGATSA